MQTTAGIGQTIHIKGIITADEPLVIAGQIEGTITVAGHALTIALDGHIDGETTADTIVIEGSAKGRLSAITKIQVHQKANIIGDLSAPAISLAEGAKVHGRIDAGMRKAASSRLVDRLAPAISAA